MALPTAFLAGLVFGLGLIVSGMADPAKVLAFLDIAGAWDPSLAFVMGGAIAVGFVAFRLAGQRTTTFLGTPLRLPVIGAADRPLLAGSALFGIGWGLAGICPAPALVLLGIDAPHGGLFVLSLLAGMALFELRRTAPAGRS